MKLDRSKKEVKMYECEECKDRGYTWMNHRVGMMVFCGCSKGIAVSERMDELRAMVNKTRSDRKNLVAVG